MTVRERMAKYQKDNGLTDYAIEKALGKSKGYWHTCKNPTAGIITLFLEVFPDISAEWLMRGEGQMLRTTEPSEDKKELLREITDRLYSDPNVLEERIKVLAQQAVEREVARQLKKEA